MNDDPYYYEDADIEGDPKAKARRDEWRRGRSAAQKKNVLQAKETLTFIRENPGCTRVDIALAGVTPNFGPLLAHGLIRWERGHKTGATHTNKSDARWYVRKGAQ